MIGEVKGSVEEKGGWNTPWTDYQSITGQTHLRLILSLQLILSAYFWTVGEKSTQT